MILQYKGMIISQSYVEACEARRRSVENAMAIMLSATNIYEWWEKLLSRKFLLN